MSGNEDGGIGDVAKFELRRSVVTTGEALVVNGRTYRLRENIQPRVLRSLGLMQSRVAASLRAAARAQQRIHELSDAAIEDGADEAAVYAEQEVEMGKADKADLDTRRWLFGALALFIADADDALRDDIRDVENVADVIDIVNHVTASVGFASAATDAEVEGVDPTEPPSPTLSAPPQGSPQDFASTASS